MRQSLKILGRGLDTGARPGALILSPAQNRERCKSYLAANS